MSNLDIMTDGVVSKRIPGEEKVWRSISTQGDELYHTTPDDCKTLYQVFQRGLSISMDKPCLGYRPGPDQGYMWQSYSEVSDMLDKIGSALVHRGQVKGCFVGISSHNNPEWTTLALACDSQSITLCPLYDTLGEEAVKFCLNQTELNLLAVSAKGLGTYLTYLPEVPNVKTIIKIGPAPTEEEVALGAAGGVEVISWAQLLKEGSEKPVPHHPPAPEDICTICYTSGTTGLPKGAMLAHSAMSSTTYGVSRGIFEYNIRSCDTNISYLPASHVFERALQYCMLRAGGRIGFWQGDVRQLSNDMQALQPTVFAAVPRILNRIYDKIFAEVGETGMKSYVFNWALSSKTTEVNKGYLRNNSMWDYLVFSKVQNMLGGKVRLMPCGAAPFDYKVLQFFRAALGAAVLEGYGQTECCGCCCISIVGDYRGGCVGGVTSNNMIKLESVPEMGYMAEDNKGEICIKGLNTFSGYYKDEAKTAETLDADGWLHTGDIGSMNADGGLSIIDRKKNIFKLSQGEYVAPEKIEILYDRCPLVAQVCVYGNSTKNNLVAIVIPEELATMKWARENDIEGDFPTVCQSKVLNKTILEQLTEIGRTGGLRSFELAKKLRINHELFSVHNDMMTPTFKFKRHNIAKIYKEWIDKMYENLD